MKKNNLLLLLLVLPSVAFAATRGEFASRVGMTRGTQAVARASVAASTVGETSATTTTSVSGDCRDAYRECMDSFCLLDETQGERCACSDNINRAKSKINEILAIQTEADKLFNEGVEREKLGAKANLIFADDTNNSHVTSANFMSWLTGGEEEEGEVGEDVELGEDLYKMAVRYCQSQLDVCGDKAEMESMLYSRMVIQDCKNYDAYLVDQKANAESNKRVAESAVRQARLEVFDTTNKYNRGECLLAFRSCVVDKGGCGANFENCLDADLLKRRSNACENVLDQCMAVRADVIKDWNAESESILEAAARYVDENKHNVCKAKVRNCLEEHCSISTNPECLVNVDIAVGICPIINECDALIPGYKDSVVDTTLKPLQIQFCENDVDKCLQNKCGQDFTKPECVGKAAYEIAELCPQDMFPSCKSAKQFDIIVQSALLQMDYQMLQGCVNYFSEQLGKVCGTDMACLPIVSSATSAINMPETADATEALKARVSADSDASVDEFFKQFEKDKTVAACVDSQTDESKRVKGKISLGTSVFNTAVLLAKQSAKQRNLRELEAYLAELSRKQDLVKAEKHCLTMYVPEKPKKDENMTNYTYIKSVSFEPKLRNCHVCRIQQVCEEGGESKAASALKAAAGGLSAGASAGTMITPGWGTAIGGAVGAVGAGIMGALSGGKKQFCQEIESCEDINM